MAIERVKQHVNGMSVDAPLPKPTNPMLVRRMDAPIKPVCLDQSTDPNQKTDIAVISAQSAGPNLAAVSLILKME
jgi:hypothetical protein